MVYVPGRPLSEFVVVLWYFRGDEIPNAKEYVLPTGAADLVFRLDSTRSSDSVMSGPRTGSVVVETTSRHELLGVHFKVGGAFPFLHFPFGELGNASVSINDIWGRHNSERLLEALHNAPTANAKFQILENWLTGLAGERLQKHPAVVFAMREFASDRFSSASELASRTGYSQRHFIELFQNEVGLTPKRFQRLHRFRKVIGNVRRLHSVDWADVASSVGYYDQAHLIHEFREFSGLTPEQYLTLRTPFTNHVRMPD